jgi:Glycosyl transferase family 11
MRHGGVVITFQRGRLGNHLFQYPAMKMFAPDAGIIAVGMDDLVRGFDGVSLSPLSLPVKGEQGLLWRVKVRLVTWTTLAMAALRLVSVVDEEESCDGPHFRVTRGLFRGITYFRSGWYQLESVADSPGGVGLQIKQHLADVAERALSSLPGLPHDRYFVHVRRGDYTTFPSVEHPAVLSLAWYRKQMLRVRDRNPDAVFVVTSDDKPYVDEFLGGDPGVFVVHLGVLEDFAVMAGCLGGGILSASTFAWWAACLARRKNSSAYFVAPRYWVGHGTHTWIPMGIQTSWIEYVDV